MSRKRQKKAAISGEYKGETPLENEKQEIFCRIFTTNTLPRFWANGTESYMFAFGRMDEIDKLLERIKDTRRLIDGPKSARKKKSIAALQRETVSIQDEIDRIRKVASSSASKLLIGPDIKQRCNYLLDQLASHSIVDRELTYLIQQRDNTEVKLNAIKHHDRREQRIRDRIDVHQFEPVKTITLNKPAIKK